MLRAQAERQAVNFGVQGKVKHPLKSLQIHVVPLIIEPTYRVTITVWEAVLKGLESLNLHHCTWSTYSYTVKHHIHLNHILAGFYGTCKWQCGVN